MARQYANQGLALMEGYRMGTQAVAEFREDQLRNDVGAAAKSASVTESLSGDATMQNFQDNYVPQEGGPATAQEFLMQNPDILKAMAPERKASFDVGGEKFATNDAARARSRGINTQAMADVYDSRGRPEEAMRLRQQARQGDLTELQIKGAERGERTAGVEEAYNLSRAKLGEQFSGSRMRAENDAATAKYEQDNAAYQESLKQNPAAAGPAPAKPSLRVMSGLDTLHDANLLMQHDMANGKVDPVKALQYQQLVSQVKKEVGTDAFKLLHTGDVEGALKAFESQGDMRVPPGAKIEARKGFYEVAGQKIPTNELVVRLPNGHTQVINGLQGMDALDAADKIIGNKFKGAELGLKKEELGIKRQEVGNSGARVAIAQQESGRAADRWSVEKPELEAKAGDSTAQRLAREGLVAAIKSKDPAAVTEAAAIARTYGVKYSVDETGSYHTSAPDAAGNVLVVDQKTGAGKVLNTREVKKKQDAATPAPAAPAPAPSQAAIDYLGSNPDQAANFDAKFGKGASARYLKK